MMGSNFYCRDCHDGFDGEFDGCEQCIKCEKCLDEKGEKLADLKQRLLTSKTECECLDASLKAVSDRYNKLRDGVEDIIKGGDAKTVLFIQIEVLQQLLKEDTN